MFCSPMRKIITNTWKRKWQAEEWLARKEDKDE